MASGNQEVLEEVREHHAHLAAELRARAEALAFVDDVRLQASERDLLDDVETEILPHARHEEETVYSEGSRHRS